MFVSLNNKNDHELSLTWEGKQSAKNSGRCEWYHDVMEL
jgi:hypothetical protein